jgi:terminase small subunit-like protein
MPRRRTTTDSKIRGGSYRPSTARPDVLLPPGVPSCPKWLTSEARAEWKRVTAAMSAAGVLAEAYRSTLAVYCALWAEVAKAKGAVTTSRLAELRKLTAELHISPHSSRVAPPDLDPAERQREQIADSGGKVADITARLLRVPRTLRPEKKP